MRLRIWCERRSSRSVCYRGSDGQKFFQDKRSGKRGSGVLAWGCHVMLKGRVEIRESEVVVGGIERLMFGGRT